MHIINKDGEIVEGQALTAEEVDILTKLSDGGLNAASGSYIGTRDARKLALYLVENFHITRRKVPACDAPTPIPTHILPVYPAGMRSIDVGDAAGAALEDYPPATVGDLLKAEAAKGSTIAEQREIINPSCYPAVASLISRKI